MWLVVLGLLVLVALLLVLLIGALDRGEAARARRSHSIPTITSLPSASARRRAS